MATTKGKGNFADDPERAREAGRKGGQSRGKTSAADNNNQKNGNK